MFLKPQACEHACRRKSRVPKFLGFGGGFLGFRWQIKELSETLEEESEDLEKQRGDVDKIKVGRVASGKLLFVGITSF